MTPEKRLRLRAALKIHEQLSAGDRQSPPLAKLPLELWQSLLSTSRRLAQATNRGWTVAENMTREVYYQQATLLAERLSVSVRAQRITPPRANVQTPAEILADLDALESEFSEIGVDLREKRLLWTTDAVVLEGIDLGRFQIGLHWQELPGTAAYDVTALEPNPAASEETTTHPHVRDERLCEGEGRIPIRRALEQGRLYDFALLVRGLLTTYNPGSAYVLLSQWQGTSCSDCGCLTAEDESMSCERCSSELCDECQIHCSDCGRCCCADCRSCCSGCDQNHCSSCLAACSVCHESNCSQCLSQGRCQHCCEEDEIEADDLPITTVLEGTFDETETTPTNEIQIERSETAVAAL